MDDADLADARVPDVARLPRRSANPFLVTLWVIVSLSLIVVLVGLSVYNRTADTSPAGAITMLVGFGMTLVSLSAALALHGVGWYLRRR